MLIFTSLLVPILISIILWVFFKHKTLWWEFLIPFGVALLIGIISKFTVEWLRTSDTEYWSGYIVKAEYYEPWNEYVHRTCTRTVSCGKNCTRTISYDCSYVQYHSEYWAMTDNNGIEFRISKSKYKHLVKRFGNESFINLNRNYHTQDGDKYITKWNNNDNDIVCVVTEHSYENRVQASDDIFNFPDIDTNDIKKYGLYDYPEVIDNSQVNLLGEINNWNIYNRKLEVLNAKLGKKKEVKVFILLFKNKDKESAFKQEAYWKGGNDNEFIICIGTDNENNVTWAHPISWTESMITKVNIRTYIEESINKTLNLSDVIDKLYIEIDTNYKRKNFDDFSYIEIEPTTGQLIWTFVIVLIVNLAVSFWIIINEHEEY